MFDQMRLGSKLMVALGISILSVAVLLSWTSLRILEGVIGQAEQAELDNHVRAVSEAIATESRTAEALATLVANLPSVQEHFAADDRNALAKLLLPVHLVMQKAFAVEQFQFHTPPARSYLRLHKVEKFGDDLSSFRHTVVRTNTAVKPTRGLEGGVAGLGIRGVVPVTVQGRHIGSVEFGMTFAQDFFDSFKARHKVDAALHLVEKDKVVTFASTIGKTSVLGDAVIRSVLQGDGVLAHADVEGKPMALYGVAMEDFSGKRIGVLELAMDRSRYVAAMNDAYRTSLLVAGLALAVALAVAVVASRSVTRRLTRLVEGVRQVAKGDLTVAIGAEGGDEVGLLGEAAAEMRSQLHALALEVRAHAQAVHRAAVEIAGAVDGQAATTSEMSASVAEITSTMEELSASSTQIAEHSKSVVDIATQTWQQSKKGSEAMGMVLERMADIRTDNQSSLTEIIELGTRSKEISKVMVIINAIADQTKLIAFNAALEAASAGEAGRRFGVVAAEIRRLADSVTDSTGEIETKVSQIQDAIQRLVVTSEKGGSSIAAGMDATGHTTARLSEMVEAAQQTTSAAQQISLSTQQQKTASNQVVVALREIVTASSHTAQSITRISDISRDMTRLSAELDILVGRFRLEAAAHRDGEPPPAALPQPAAAPAV